MTLKISRIILSILFKGMYILKSMPVCCVDCGLDLSTTRSNVSGRRTRSSEAPLYHTQYGV